MYVVTFKADGAVAIYVCLSDQCSKLSLAHFLSQRAEHGFQFLAADLSWNRNRDTLNSKAISYDVSWALNQGIDALHSSLVFCVFLISNSQKKKKKCLDWFSTKAISTSNHGKRDRDRVKNVQKKVFRRNYFNFEVGVVS